MGRSRSRSTPSEPALPRRGAPRESDSVATTSSSRLLHRFAAGSRLGSAAAAAGIRGGRGRRPRPRRSRRGRARGIRAGRRTAPCRDTLTATTRASTKPTGSGIPRQIQTGSVLGGAFIKEDEGPPPAQVDDHGVAGRNPASPAPPAEPDLRLDHLVPRRPPPLRRGLAIPQAGRAPGRAPALGPGRDGPLGNLSIADPSASRSAWASGRVDSSHIGSSQASS